MLQLPDTKNYFEFYGFDNRYQIDPEELKNRFLEKSKIYHPDLHMNNERDHQIAVAASSFNNLAYKTLSGDVSRALHLLDLMQQEQGPVPSLPQDFLMEMLELNENIDEINGDNRDDIEDQIHQMKKEGKAEIERLAVAQNWQELRIAILKWKYLERLETRMAEL